MVNRFIAITSLCAVAAFASADFIDFESDSAGTKPNGFMSVSSAAVVFNDTLGADMDVFNYGTQSIGQGLAVNGDDASMLEMVFTGNMSFLSLVFGNDDPGFSSAGDLAVLRTYNGATLLNTFTVVMDRDDTANQSIVGTGSFNRATFSYETPGLTPINLIEIVDNIEFTPVPEPATMAALGIGALALLRRRRKA
jgi:hypothetical protein